MNKKVLTMLVCCVAMTASAQDAFDVLHLSQTELRGTSRFMSMAGAFGALGGDISVMNQNPAGIGVYRSSDVGITFSLDLNSSKPVGGQKDSQTKFNVNNIGYVGAMKLNSEVMPNFNWGFSYNRVNSFHRHYRGGFDNIPTSLSNYIAGQLNGSGITANDLVSTTTYNPYFNSPYAPWIGIVSYDIATKTNGAADIISENNGHLQGLYGDGTTGFAEYEVDESGHTDEYSINFGGNLANVLYWGLGFGITDLSYDSYHYYGESLDNAYIKDSDNWQKSQFMLGGADFGFVNYLNTKGTGYNFKMGVIFKPVNQLRIGLAFHTPTYYELRDSYYLVSNMAAFDGSTLLYEGEKGSNGGYYYRTDYSIKTPWRFMGSLAGVIGQKGILSLDYEYVGNETMRVGDDTRNHNEFPDVTNRVKEYFAPSHIIRVGGEFRVTPQWSLRAGYSYKTTQVKDVVDNYRTDIVTVGTDPSYQYDTNEQNITCGFGYKYKSVYLDMAYVHKMRKSVYNAFSPVTSVSPIEPNLSTDVTDNNNRISLTLGFRF
ncbi:MAG: outer membrane protein transport protein [Muribaculaceae bacterium]|nr:outer membrane protein transport protein [Muribaculaceae bacterium]